MQWREHGGLCQLTEMWIYCGEVGQHCKSQLTNCDPTLLKFNYKGAFVY